MAYPVSLGGRKRDKRDRIGRPIHHARATSAGQSVLRAPPLTARRGSDGVALEGANRSGDGTAVARSGLGQKGPSQTETINEAHIPI